MRNGSFAEAMDITPAPQKSQEKKKTATPQDRMSGHYPVAVAGSRFLLGFRPSAVSDHDYKSTLNLPETAFPMKADLAQKEPKILARWDEMGLYERVLAARRGGPVYAFHDGPPYANGSIHYGHILNKTLKDMVVKFRSMLGYYVEYRPGWDCHGLPIELAVLRNLGEKAAALSAIEIRRACHAYAMKWVDTQRRELQRLGAFATWDRPYLTLLPDYEATIVRELARVAEQGLLYRDKKPVHWCMSDRTALAEAEILYDDAHVSPSIYVRFAIPSDPKLYAVIWTTTPWTLPANLGIAYHPRLEYVTITARGARHIVAKELADTVVGACGLTEEGPREPFPVERFAQLRAARHPFIDRDSIFLPGEHVTLDAGTGLVHTAPGHGADDYVLGREHKLPPYAPVDDAGVFTEGPWQGEHIWKANPKIVERLAADGALLSSPSLSVTHSYPICWRCKKAIIFRATFQWFVRMDRDAAPADARPTVDLRRVALAEIERTAFIPPWGRNRLRGMIEHRPDWVLSRQRAWGVPIPILYKKDAPDQVLDASPAFMRKVAELIAAEGADAWFARSGEELAKLAGHDAATAANAQKGGDIVDVWFESGVSFAAVCEGKPGLDASTSEDPRPIDLYLEGSDQHRGWFHTSLLTSCATRGRAPYRALLTHGFILDDNGKPYSKSEIERARKEGKKVSYIEPSDVIKQQGAELLRMWVAQADFRSDVSYSRAHLDQLGESYRKVRNTIRFLLGNLAGFDPHSDAKVALTDPLDQHMWERASDLAGRIRAAYEAVELHTVLRAIVDFCTVDLSAGYCDVRKDRLYCDGKSDPLRLGTQKVLYRCLRVITCGMAPILCFTSEEVWGMMPRQADHPESVHLAELEAGPTAMTGMSAESQALWERMRQLRQDVQRALEPFRAQKKASLDASVTLTRAPGDPIGQAPYGPVWLADFLIVSEVKIAHGPESIAVAPATGNHCARCWKWTPAEPPLCERCRGVVGAHKQREPQTE
jgi:isoleucyl-tRNA synthetase